MNLLEFLKWLLMFVFSSGGLVVSLLVGGLLILYVWRTAGRYAEKGGVMFWAIAFRWVFAVLIGLSTMLFIFAILRGSPMVTQWVLNELAASRDVSAGLVLPSLEANKNSPGPNNIFTLTTPNAPATGLQPVTLPADVAEVYPQAVKLALAPGVNEVQLYDRAGNPIEKVKKDITVCGRSVTNWLIGCPVQTGPLFSPLQVNWQAAGLKLQIAIATPTPQPTKSPAEILAICELKWRLWWNNGVPTIKGVDFAIVPKGMKAELLAPGASRALGGKYALKILDFASQPQFTINDEALIKGLIGLNPFENIAFTGAGAQCGQ